MLSGHRLSFSDPLQGSTCKFGGGEEKRRLKGLQKGAMQKNAERFVILIALNTRKFAILMALNARKFAVLMAVGRAGLDGVTGTSSQRIHSETRNRNAHAFA